MLATIFAVLAILVPGVAGTQPERRADAFGLRAVAAQPEWRSQVVGRSVEGRPIRALAVGSPLARRRILVVGCIHGDECEGFEVTRRLARARIRPGAALWIVHQLNPDGFARRTRQNARGVDLNRNFPSEWRRAGRAWDAQYPGPRPLSEPETRAARRLVLRVRPHVTLWFHQPQALVRAWGRSRAPARRYARLGGARYASLRWPPGSAPNWQNRRFARGVSVVVELPRGDLGGAAAWRYAKAIVRLGGR